MEFELGCGDHMTRRVASDACVRVCVCVWWSGSNLGTSAKACDGFFRDSNLVLTDEQNERHYCESIGMDTILR